MKHFKVEIRKTCKVCNAPITGKRCRTYCSTKCRDKFFANKYNDYRTAWQKKRRDEIASVPSPDKMQCMICKKWYVQVGSHIWLTHHVTARDYRKEYGFDVKKGQLPDWYKEIKSEQVFENGTVNNLKKGKKNWFKKGQKGVGIYERSPQTLHRLSLGTKILTKK